MTNIRLRVLPAILPIDGKQIELRTTETDIEWRYVTDFLGEYDWTVVVSLEEITGPTGTITDGTKADVTVSDDGETWTVNPGVIDAARISDLLEERAAISKKLLVLSKEPDQKIYFNADTGDDDTGDGTKANPYEHEDRARMDMSIMTNGLCEIRGGGTVTDTYRDPADMERPALFYIDQLQLGRRTDMDGAELVGGLVIKQEPDYPDLVLQPNATYPRGFYVTGGVGSVGFQDFLIDCQAGAESGGVAHRDVYVQTKDIEVDGNGIATFGFVSEATGFMENLGAHVHHVGTAGLAYAGTVMGFALATNIHDISGFSFNAAGGDILVSDGATLVGNSFSDLGGIVSIAGAATTLSGDVEVRAAGNYVAGSITHTSGTITNYGAVDMSAVSYGGLFKQLSGTHRFNGVNSYLSPATASPLRTPYDIQGGDGFVSSNSNIVNSEGTNLAPQPISLAPGYLFGLTLSNAADTVNDITVAAGRARDNANQSNMVLHAAITKRLDATWAAGTNAGGLDTGAVGDGTYHVWLIRHLTTGDVDALFSLSVSSPTLPPGYGNRRRIGSIVRASGSIQQFIQTGDEFRLLVPVTDYSIAPNTAAAVSPSLPSLPNGLSVLALLHVQQFDNSVTTARATLVTALDQTDTAPVVGGIGQLQTTGTTGTAFAVCTMQIRTNTARQIRYRISAADADVFIRINVDGWIDRRGRDA